MDEAEEPYVTFVQYIMMTMFEPGENKQLLVETVIRNLWTRCDHAHVFQVEFVDATGTFEAIWLGMQPSMWSEWLRSKEIELDKAIESAIEALEAEANSDDTDD